MKLPFLNFYCHWGIFPDYSIIYNLLITTQFVNNIYQAKINSIETSSKEVNNKGETGSRDLPGGRHPTGIPGQVFPGVRIPLFTFIIYSIQSYLMCVKYMWGRGFKT